MYNISSANDTVNLCCFIACHLLQLNGRLLQHLSHLVLTILDFLYLSGQILLHIVMHHVNTLSLLTVQQTLLSNAVPQQ